MKNKYLTMPTASLFLFLISLTLDAFYVGETHKPFSSFSLLLSGWLGLIAGYIAWLANPLYFFAYVKINAQPKKSFAYGSAAFLLSLTFLFKKNMVMNENGSESPIFGYGWGYYLWVLSIGMLAINQYKEYCKTKNDSSKNDLKTKLANSFIFEVILFSLISIPFLLQYYVGESSHFNIEKQRNEFYNKNCSGLKKTFYVKPHQLQSIYFSQDWGATYNVGSIETGTLGEPFLNIGMLKFYETVKNENDNAQLKRFYFKDFKGESIEEITSDYSVITTDLTKDLPKRLDIVGYEISIFDNQNKKIIAKTSYYVNNTTYKQCLPDSASSYSTRQFVIDALHLKRDSFPH